MAVVTDQLGPQVATFLSSLIESTVEGQNQAATFIGVGLLLFASTNLFTAMQGALNTIWGVEEPRYTGLLQQLFMRALSLLIMLALAVIAIVALSAQTVLNAVADRLSENLGGFEFLVSFGTQLLTLMVMTLVFVAVHKILIHRRVGWKPVAVGALLTALLFRIGQELILLYLRTSAVSSAFGAAGTLVALLLFIYYAMQIFLLGAAFTRQYAERLAEHRCEPCPVPRVVPSRSRGACWRSAASEQFLVSRVQPELLERHRSFLLGPALPAAVGLPPVPGQYGYLAVAFRSQLSPDGGATVGRPFDDPFVAEQRQLITEWRWSVPAHNRSRAASADRTRFAVAAAGSSSRSAYWRVNAAPRRKICIA